jgi:ABC-type glycerol-3-phosphate transport system substrate-binding protein
VGQPQVWAVPWTTYAYILYFRRDILEQASIDEKTAFASAEAFDHTLGRLQAAGVEVPWVLPTAPPYLDLVHIAASWVRGAGGNYISEDGTRSLLGQPKTIAGFKAFFDLYRYIPGSVRRRNMDQCLDLFARGGAAMIVTGAEMGASVLGNPNASPRLRDNLGTCVLPGVPWIGGDNLVIWRHTSGYPEVEEMAFALVKYLTSYDVQVRYSRALYNLPSRRDAFPALEHPVGSLSTTLEQVIHAGRAHPSVRLWARVEYQLGESLDQVVQQILINPSVDLNDILPGVLNGTSWRLDLILKN